MMHGGGNTNYSLELLRLLYGIHHLWMDEWMGRVLLSMLVNPKGGAGGWMATNMLQENHNYLIKTIFSANGSNMSWEYLRDTISTNIKTFQSIARMFEWEVRVGTNSTKHKTSSPKLDINRIKKYLQNSSILWKSGQCAQGPSVVDLQVDGGNKMAGGAIIGLLDRSQLENAVDVEGTKDLDHVFD